MKGGDTMVRAFVVGAVVGGVAVVVWGDRARAYVNARIRRVSENVIDVLDRVTNTLEGWRTQIDQLGRSGIADGDRRGLRDASSRTTGAAVK
jgi:hypothetical protein